MSSNHRHDRGLSHPQLVHCNCTSSSFAKAHAGSDVKGTGSIILTCESGSGSGRSGSEAIEAGIGPDINNNSTTTTTLQQSIQEEPNKLLAIGYIRFL